LLSKFYLAYFAALKKQKNKQMQRVRLGTTITVGLMFLAIVGFVVNNLLGYFFIPEGKAVSLIIAVCGCSIFSL